jgi:hypothetical protein
MGIGRLVPLLHYPHSGVNNANRGYIIILQADVVPQIRDKQKSSSLNNTETLFPLPRVTLVCRCEI